VADLIAEKFRDGTAVHVVRPPDALQLVEIPHALTAPNASTGAREKKICNAKRRKEEFTGRPARGAAGAACLENGASKNKIKMKAVDEN
jgi:hypothetical protein